MATFIPWSHSGSAGFTLRGWYTEPSGKPLLHFLHGNGFCGRTYEPMLSILAEHFDLWLSDAQGHGGSDPGDRFVGWNRSAALAVEAFEAGRARFGDVTQVAVGHSFGGVLTGLILAEHPSLFDRAVLLDPVLFSPTMLGIMAFSDVLGLYRRNKLATRTRRRRRQWPTRASAIDSLRGRGMFVGWTEEALEAYAKSALRPTAEGVGLCCPPELEAAIFSSFPKRLWPALAQIQTPTHLLVGVDSYPFVGQAARRLASRNASVSYEQISGGHCFMQEKPRLSAERVSAYLLANAETPPALSVVD
ncbi:alpha/beta fold hydrolase [Pseudomonas sp. Marseille-QA0892]